MNDISNLEERRITLRLLAYWEKKRGVRAMPEENDIDPADLADLWENCFLAQVKDLGKDHHFTYLGSAIHDIYAQGLTEEDDREHIHPDIEALASHYHEVIAKSAPVVTEGEFSNPHGDLFKYRQVLLPLGQGKNVKAVFGGMRFLRIRAYGS